MNLPDVSKHLVFHLLFNISAALGEKKFKDWIWAELAVSESRATSNRNCSSAQFQSLIFWPKTAEILHKS